MKRARGISAVLVVTATLVVAAPASASVITVGSPLTGSFTNTTCSNCTIAQKSAVSPVNGVVLRWRVMFTSPSVSYRLRVLSPFSTDLVATSGAATQAVKPAGNGLEVFPAGNLPIRIGDTIALDTTEFAAAIGWKPTPGMGYRYASPPLSEGEARKFIDNKNEFEIAYNADVLPAPTTFSVAPASGSIAGGTLVTIAGTDLSQVTGVSFGGVPAPLFQAQSDSQLTAVTPPGAALGAVPVSVTTIAGTTATAFTYEGCTVPKLRGRKLKASKKQVRAGGCKVGPLTKRKGAKAATGKVVGQNPKPGAILPPGTQVKITIAP